MTTSRTESFYRYAGEIAEDLDTPVIAVLGDSPPTCRRDQSDELETFANAEMLDPVIRALRASTRSVHVAGISGDVGRDAISLSLARVLAETGRRILVVDADADGPALAEPGALGITDVLAGDAAITQAVVPSPGYEGMMAFLPIGSRPAMLEAPGAVEPLVRVLEDLRPSYDVMLVSSPCLDRRGKVHPVATACEVVLLVLSPGVVSRDRIRRNFLQLWGVEAPIEGLVTLGVPDVLAEVVRESREESEGEAAPNGGAAAAAAAGAAANGEEDETPLTFDEPADADGVDADVDAEPAEDAPVFDINGAAEAQAPEHAARTRETPAAASGERTASDPTDETLRPDPHDTSTPPGADDEHEAVDFIAGLPEGDSPPREDRDDVVSIRSEQYDVVPGDSGLFQRPVPGRRRRETPSVDAETPTEHDASPERDMPTARDVPVASDEAASAGRTPGAEPPTSTEIPWAPEAPGEDVSPGDSPLDDEPEAPAPEDAETGSAPSVRSNWEDVPSFAASTGDESPGLFDEPRAEQEEGERAAVDAISTTGPRWDDLGSSSARSTPDAADATDEIAHEAADETTRETPRETPRETVDEDVLVPPADPASGEAPSWERSPAAEALVGAGAPHDAGRAEQGTGEGEASGRSLDDIERIAFEAVHDRRSSSRRRREGQGGLVKFLIWGLGGAAVLAAIVLFVVPLLNQGSSDGDFALELPEDGPGAAESEDIPDEAVVTRDNLGASAAPEGEAGDEASGEATGEAIGGSAPESDGGASVPETGDETREAATEVPTRSQEPTRTRPVRESQAPERAEAAPSAPAPQPPASPPPATVEATSGAQGAPIMKSTRFAGQPPFFAIHITSFRSEDRATRDAERLGRETGHGADYIDFNMTSGENAGLWYRVIVGRFSDIETARREAREIVNEGISTYARVFYITGS